jgi:hypothetical protein
VNDDVRQALKGIGPLQKQLLVWLGSSQGIKTREDLVKRWPSSARRPPQLSAIVDVVSAMREPTHEATRYAPYLKESYFSGSEEEVTALPDGFDWIAWESKEFLGRAASQNESVSISKGIKSLERRGLIRTAKAFGKRKRVSHIALTFEGEVASVLLQMNAVSPKGRGLSPTSAA